MQVSVSVVLANQIKVGEGLTPATELWKINSTFHYVSIVEHLLRIPAIQVINKNVAGDTGLT